MGSFRYFRGLQSATLYIVNGILNLTRAVAIGSFNLTHPVSSPFFPREERRSDLFILLYVCFRCLRAWPIMPARRLSLSWMLS